MNAQVLLVVMVGSVRIKSMDSFVPVLMGLQTTLARQVRAVKINIELRPNFIKQKQKKLAKHRQILVNRNSFVLLNSLIKLTETC